VQFLPLNMVIFRRVRKIANGDCWLHHVFLSFFLSVCPPAWDNSVPTGWIFMKFDIRGFLENLPRKIKFHSNIIRRAGTLHEDLCTFRIISR
jgi:hypothetical protein